MAHGGFGSTVSSYFAGGLRSVFVVNERNCCKQVRRVERLRDTGRVRRAEKYVFFALFLRTSVTCVLCTALGEG